MKKKRRDLTIDATSLIDVFDGVAEAIHERFETQLCKCVDFLHFLVFVNVISLGFGLLFWRNKTFKDATLGFWGRAAANGCFTGTLNR